MTTMRTILTQAIRKTRQRPLGDAPEAEEMEAALEDAQALFLTLTNRQLRDVLVTAAYTAGEDERVNTGGVSLSITLPTSITEGGVARPPRAGAIVEVAINALERHIYVPELAAWKALAGLELTDEQPFGPSLDEAVADMLAARLCSSVFQVDPPAVAVALASQGRSTFDARFAPPITAQVDPGLLRPTCFNSFIQ